MKYSEVIEQISAELTEVEEGINDALPFYADIKQLQAFLSAVLAQVEQLAIDEAEKYEGKTFTAFGFQFTRNEGRTMYNFKNIPQWAKLKAELERVESFAKQAAQTSILTGGHVIVDEYGEVVQSPETTKTKSSLSVKPIS